jgi:SAM (Sterile alpha motif) domain-containing protein
MDVAQWLHDLGLEKYEAKFRDSRIDEAVLPNLTAGDLTDLGVAIGDRRRLLDAIAALGVEKKRSDARDDFTRRFVAVAVSVGFATFLVRMQWLSEDSFPSFLEINQLVRLFVALGFIVLGWEWYHRDIGRSPGTTDFTLSPSVCGTC